MKRAAVALTAAGLAAGILLVACSRKRATEESAAATGAFLKELGYVQRQRFEINGLYSRSDL